MSFPLLEFCLTLLEDLVEVAALSLEALEVVGAGAVGGLVAVDAEAVGCLVGGLPLLGLFAPSLSALKAAILF